MQLLRDILGLLPSKFKLSNVTEDLVLQLLKDMNIDKAAGIDNLPGKFLKKGSTTLPKSYHPISLLPLISKIIEKMIDDQTQAFLDEKKVLYRFQSGFRKTFSADSCISCLNYKITTGFESGLHSGMILIDVIFNDVIWMLYSSTCRQTFWGMSPKIPGNVAKDSGECR